MNDPQPLWKPTDAQMAAANMTAFMRYAKQEYGAGIDDYDSLWRWSVAHREEFWPAVWSFCGVVAGRRWDRVLIDGDQMPGAKWFTGARLNFAENCLRYRDRRPAIIFWNEHGRQQSLTFAELYGLVARLAEALREWGITTGDRVAAFMPNIPETMIITLAAASLGASFASCSPDFGVPAVLDRIGQLQPKILFTADGYRYGGKAFDSLEPARGIAAAIASIERTVVVPYLQDVPVLDGLTRAVHLAEAMDNPAGEVRFEQLPFDHPLYILFSSGTTGVPKCIVHGAGGTLLQHQKEHVLHTDLKPDDRLFYFTTCSWMMWNWLLSALAVGSTILLYDGSPFHPDGNILFDLAEAEGMTVFGTSAKYISAVEKAGLAPAETHDLSTVRTILSTGSPLAEESFDFVYRRIKPDVCLSSISGGTDIVSCFALGNPICPVWRGELQTRGLGMNVAVFDDDGRRVVGEKGELVCTAAFPSMPVYFWNDPDGKKYREAYFERFPNVWSHGDYAEITCHDGLVIYGRSDAVLNPGGVRIGTAEIYRLVEQLPEVVESIVVAQQWEGDVRVVLFVRLRDGLTLEDALVAEIKQQIRSGATPRHVPDKVIQVADIPRTKSGKIVELTVRDVIHGRRVTNRHALANPEALDLYRDLPDLNT